MGSSLCLVVIELVFALLLLSAIVDKGVVMLASEADSEQEMPLVYAKSRTAIVLLIIFPISGRVVVVFCCPRFDVHPRRGGLRHCPNPLCDHRLWVCEIHPSSDRGLRLELKIIPLRSSVCGLPF